MSGSEWRHILYNDDAFTKTLSSIWNTEVITPPQEKDLEEFVVSKLYKLVYSYCIVYCQVSDNCVFVCIVKLVTI